MSTDWNQLRPLLWAMAALANNLFLLGSSKERIPELRRRVQDFIYLSRHHPHGVPNFNSDEIRRRAALLDQMTHKRGCRLMPDGQGCFYLVHGASRLRFVYLSATGQVAPTSAGREEKARAFLERCREQAEQCLRRSLALFEARWLEEPFEYDDGLPLKEKVFRLLLNPGVWQRVVKARPAEVQRLLERTLPGLSFPN